MQLAGGQFFLQGFIHALLTLHTVLPDEFATHDDSLEMLAVAIEFEKIAGHTGQDQLLDMFGVHLGQALSFQPRFSRLSVPQDTTAKQATTTSRLVSGATSETPKKPYLKPSIM